MAAKKKAKSAQQIKRQKMLANLAKGRATRAANLAKKKQQAAAMLASMTPAQQKAVGKAATKARASGKVPTATKKAGTKKRARKGTVTTNLSSRAKKLANAIRTGRVAVRQGVKTVTQAQGATKRAKYQKFLAIYKDVRVPKKFSGVKNKSPRYNYRLVPGVQGQTKFPYYLAAGYTSRVGGGASGPGVVRTIPKSGAPPFRSLSDEQQRRIIAFLNSAEGKKLRGKGAKRSVTFQAVKQALKTVRSGPGVAKKKASANYGW